jgi:hypothetical protein
MANETGLDSTGISTAVPAWLRAIALEARYAKKRVWSHCFNAVEGDPEVQGKITKAGDRVTIQIFPSFSATDISTTDGSSTDTETSPTAKSVTINKWKNVSATLVDIVDYQAIIDWETNFAKGFGGAIAQIQEDDLLALVAALTTNVDSTGGSFTDAKVRAAQAVLDDGEVPKDGRCWAICPQAHSDLLNIDKFVLANTTGFSKGIAVGDGRVVGLYGTPVEVTSRITTTSSKRDNVLFHKEAFGVITQKDFKLEKFARTQYATRYGGSALYGVATLRDNHAVWVTSAT